MKALKVIGILLLVILGIGLIASLVLPKDLDVSESISIDAPMDVVWNNVNTWEKIDKWSPWYEEDPDMKVTFEGEPGTLESVQSWSGSENVGTGSQQFTAINPDEHKIEAVVKFVTPMEGEGNTSFALEDEGEGKTKMTWTYHQHSGIPGNLFAAIFGAKGMISGMYQKGLNKLKEIAEAEAAAAAAKPSYEIKSERRESKNYVVKRETVKWADMKKYFETGMPAIAQAVGMENMAGPPSALYFTWDEENQQTEMSVAIPVGDIKAPEGYEIYTQEEGECLVIEYYGAYDQSESAHMAMAQHIESNDQLDYRGAVLEEYITDPGTEPDTSKWLTKIVYPVAAKAQATADSAE